MVAAARDARVIEVVERLRRFDATEPAALSWFVPRLREVTGAETTVAYSFAELDERFALDAFALAGSAVPEAKVTAVLDDWMRTQGRNPGSYDARRPEAWQRGRVVTTSSPTALLRDGVPPPYRGKLIPPDERAIELFLGPVGGDRATSRVLVCEGASLLAYVGMFQADGFRTDQSALLRALVAPLTRRLALERQLGDAQLHRLGLEAALEHLPVAAFLVSTRGAIVAANIVARAWLTADRTVAPMLARRAGPTPSVFDVTPLASGYLAVRRTVVEATPRLTSKARTWALTRRETEVASWLIRAATNRTIADELGCAERTIEIHVSRILAKADAESRADLIVKILGP